MIIPGIAHWYGTLSFHHMRPMKIADPSSTRGASAADTWSRDGKDDSPEGVESRFSETEMSVGSFGIHGSPHA